MQPRTTKIGRNDPCPCGSARKYKQCCLQQDEARAVAAAALATSKRNLLQEGKDHHRAGQLAEAAALYQQILQSQPGNPEALRLLALVYYNLGVTHHAQGEWDAAADSYGKALALNPNDSRVHGNLGALLQAQGRLAAAIDCYLQAIALNPADAGAHSNLAVALETQDDVDAAIRHYRQSLELDPDEPKTLNNLGNALRDREQLGDAVECLRKAIALKPDYAEAHNNLGNALQDQGELDAAIASFHCALSLNPDFLDAHWNESLALLMQGKLEEGWPLYDSRLRLKERIAGYRGLPEAWPMYRGEDLGGKTLLVWAEQGVGDEIHFSCLLPDVIRAAGHCVVECDARLLPLYVRSFPSAEFIPKLDPPHPRTRDAEIRWQCPIGSLPRFFRPSIDSFPPHHGCLVPDPERVRFWEQRLAVLGPAPKIGICWRSRHRSASRNLHYTELRQWGPILRLPGLTFVNLQYDECSDELEAVRRDFGVQIHAWDDIDQMNDLDDVAALMKALDLVIAPTTAPVWLACAVGTPTWILTTRHSIWQTLGTESIPLFPDLRPIWRPRGVAWDGILEIVAAKLRDEIARP